MTLVGKTITVELKNGIMIQGILVATDHYLNIRMKKIQVVDAAKYPHFASIQQIFIRGSSIRYVSLPKNEVDTTLLQESCRRYLIKESDSKSA